MDTIKENVDLKSYTYFKIGGAARYFVEVSTEQELQSAVNFAHEHRIPFCVLGAASNVLVSDDGYQGLIIRMLFRDIKREGSKMIMGAGVPNAVFVARTISEGLSGAEWAIGIPGTIGGSVRGNAGCFGGEMKDIVERVRVLNSDTGNFEDHDSAFCAFGYRESIFKKNPQYSITSVTCVLKNGNPATSQRLVRHYSLYRSRTQDIGMACAGCVFKNVPWPRESRARERLSALIPQLIEFKNHATIPVAILIDHVGLKGRTIGGASISHKHANYFINNGNARAEDIIMLIGLVKEYIHRKFDMHVEEEIQFLGF